MEENKKNAFQTYNIIAGWYAENRYKGLLEKEYLDKLISITGKEATVLDLGCGTGIPVMSYLLDQGMQVTGVDASIRILDIAKKNLPSADFIQADMREFSSDRKYDAIIAWNSFFHLPAEDQPAMFDNFSRHLNNGGVLLFTSGTVQGEAWGMNGGENLFHASLDSAQYRALLEARHFNILVYREDDPDCGNATVWMAQLQDNN